MDAVILLAKVLFSVAFILFLGVIFFSYMKYLKRTYYPNWKFPDYISVGYAEYLYRKYIKKFVQRIVKAK